MNIHIDTLPPYEAITCEPLRDAAAAFSAAKSEANARKRDTAALEQERPAVEWAQAEAIEAAQNAGKPAPKRDLLVEHDKKIDTAKMAEKVAIVALKRRTQELEEAVAQHGPAWGKEVAARNVELDEQWSTLMGVVETLHRERASARKMVRAIGGNQLHVASLSFRQRQLVDIELAKGSQNVARVWLADVLAGLRELGLEKQPESKPVAYIDQPEGVRDAG